MAQRCRAQSGSKNGDGDGRIDSVCSFEEDQTSCRIVIEVSPDTVAKRVEFKLQGGALTVGIRGCEPFISNEVLTGPVDVEESTWELLSKDGQRELAIELCKRSRGLWGRPFVSGESPPTPPKPPPTAQGQPVDTLELADRVEAHFKRVADLRKMAEDGRDEEAVPGLLEVLGQPDCWKEVEVRCCLAECYWKQSRLLAALDECGKAIEACKDASWLQWAKLKRADINFTLGRPDDCIREMREILAVHPDDRTVRARLAHWLQSLGRMAEALQLFRSILEEDNTDENAALQAGVCAASMGQHREAARFFALLKEPDPIGFALTQSHDPKAGDSLEKQNLAILYGLVNALCLGEAGAELAAERKRSLLSTSVAVVDANLRLTEQAHKSTWDLIASTPLGAAPNKSFFYCEWEIMQLAMTAARLPDGLLLEFGVFHGKSLGMIAGHFPNDQVHGFDSLRGLPEQWGEQRAGQYSTQGALPNSLPSNAQMHVGLFKDTLPTFLKEHPGPVRFMNVDCDLYSSTKDVFDCVSDRIVPGTVIHFDEYILMRNWQNHEYKAFQEAVADHGWTFEYLTFGLPGCEAVVRITGVNK